MPDKRLRGLCRKYLNGRDFRDITCTLQWGVRTLTIRYSYKNPSATDRQRREAIRANVNRYITNNLNLEPRSSSRFR